MKRFLVLTALLLMFCPCYIIKGQTKSETRQYNSTLKKGTLKAYDKFLTKYKNSVYYPEILYKRDSIIYNTLNLNDVVSVMQFTEDHPDSPFINEADLLIERLNTSMLTDEQATSIMESMVPLAADAPSPQVGAVGFRKLNTDYILGVSVGEADCPLSQYKLYIIKQSDDIWQTDTVLFKSKYIFGGKMNRSAIIDSVRLVSIDKHKFVSFSYINKSNDGRTMEYITNLFDSESHNVYSATFYGNNITPAKGGRNDTLHTGYAIEGQSPDAMAGGLISPETAFLLNILSSNPALVQISEENALADESVDWWYSKNPKAETSARSLTFGVITKENGIAKRYVAEKSKEKSRTYNAALFNHRGNTMICAYSKQSREFILVWCEPQAKNKNRDKLLNTIYFEGDNTLVLFYYQGNKTFKIRVNLANKTVTR